MIIMPKNYTLKAETGYLTSKLQGEQEPDQQVKRVELNDMVLSIVGMHNQLIVTTEALNDANRFMQQVRTNANSEGYIEAQINMENLEQLIQANEEVLGKVSGPK